MQVRDELCNAMKFIHSKGWSPATGGNFSVVTSHNPLKLLMAPSGVDKGSVTSEMLIEVNQAGELVGGKGKVSAEALIHIAIAKVKKANCILHTHSIANTVLSVKNVNEGQLVISNFEMLKALDGNSTHECEEIVPIVTNSQDMPKMAGEVERILKSSSRVKGILLAGHGLYTWGDDVFSARRHVEGFEFLFEVLLRF